MIAGLCVGVGSGSGIASAATTFSSATDVGTLGGTTSYATAVCGTVVVGYSDTTDDLAQHAFAYDTADPSPHMIDLGTLGGTSSYAQAVDGTIVVGYSDTTDNAAQHAFAYDLADPSPQMIDLNTIENATTSASGVSGNIVVGAWRIGDRGQRFSWYYDLAAASPEMVDLGAIAPNGGFHVTELGAVDNGVVVGTSYAGLGQSQHAFAYDIADPSPHFEDLGTFGGTSSFAAALSGSIVVGSAAIDENGTQKPFAYDRAAASPQRLDLGTLGGSFGSARAIDGNVVVGESQYDNGKARAFAYDLAAASPHMVDLGTLSGHDVSEATGVAVGIVVGNSANSTTFATRAFAYDFNATSPQMANLGTLGGANSFAKAISTTGLIIGNADTSSGASHAALWQATSGPDPTDAVAPTVSVTTPPSGAIYTQGQSVAAGYSCSDEVGGSGVASCVGSAADAAAIDTSIPGTRVFTVTATDVAGNTSTTNVTYHVVAPSHVNGSVGPGGTLTTDTGAGTTPDAPLQTAITSPNAGTLDIAQGAATLPTPVGYGLLGFEAVVTAPDATVANPLLLTFHLDAALLAAANTDPAHLVVFRDGVPIGACTNPAVAVAAPDPCIFSRIGQPDGDAEISVYSSHASHWNFGKQLTTPAAVSITTASVPGGRVGVAYAKELTATGGAPPRAWSIASGALPAGLTLNASTGVISGTPTAAGNSSFSVRATDTSVPTPLSATKAFAITIAATANPSAAKVGVPYWSKVSSFTGVAPYHWSVSAGSLPGGLTLNPNTGAISGTPTIEGKFSFSVQVVDSKPRKPNKVVTKLTIAVAPIAIVLAPATLPPATKNVRYSATISASGGAPSYRYTVTAGALPRGLTLGSGGALTGKSSVKGTFTFTVTAIDKYGFTGARQFALVVN